MKQSKLRRRRVIRFAIFYYVMFVVFLALIVGPSVAGDKIPFDLSTVDLPFRLVQPNDLENDNTNGTSVTGTGRPNYSGVYQFSTESDGGGATDKIKLF